MFLTPQYRHSYSGSVLVVAKGAGRAKGQSAARRRSAHTPAPRR